MKKILLVVAKLFINILPIITTKLEAFIQSKIDEATKKQVKEKLDVK